MGGDSSSCMRWPYHYGDSYDRGQCGAFEMVTFPLDDKGCNTDFTATPTCTFSNTYLFGAVFAPIIAVLIIAITAYVLFWRSNGANKVHRIVAMGVVLVWVWAPCWLANTKFRDDIDRTSNATFGRYFGVMLFTIFAAFITLVSLLCYMGAAGVIYLCRSKPEPTPGSPSIMSPNHSNHFGATSSGYNSLHEPLTTTSSSPSHVSIAVATPTSGHTSG